MSLWPTQLEKHRFVEVTYESPGTLSLTDNAVIEVLWVYRMLWDTGLEQHVASGMELYR
jgi:hypothetical protein